MFTPSIRTIRTLLILVTFFFFGNPFISLADVSVDTSASTVVSTDSNKCNLNLTVNEGSGGIVLVGVTYYDNYQSPHGVLSVNYPGATFRLVEKVESPNAHTHIELWIGEGVSAQSGQLSVTLKHNGKAACGAVSLHGVDLENPLKSIKTATSVNSAGKTEITTFSTEGNLVMSFFGCDSCQIASQNGSLLWKEIISGAGSGGANMQVGASSQTLSWNADWASVSMLMIGVDVQKASGAGVDPDPDPIDTQKPSQPKNLTASALSSTSVRLNWDTSTDNVGVTEYIVYRGRNIIGRSTVNNFIENNLKAGKKYTYKVAATDAAGNISRQSAAVSVTTPQGGGDPVIEPPIVTLSANPANVEFGQKSTITWSSERANYCIFNTGQTGTSGSFQTPILNDDVTYNLSCVGNGTTTKSVTVTVEPEVVVPPPNSSLASSPIPPSDYVLQGRTFDPNETLNTPIGNGTIYYVDGARGSDTNNGLSLTSAFKTIQKGINTLSGGGDTLLIRGGQYRERISIVNKDGVNGNPFVIGPYNGERVIIDASDALQSGWELTDSAKGIYRARVGFGVGDVVVDNEPLYLEKTLAGLQSVPTLQGVPTDRRFFYDSGAGYVYVRLGNISPSEHDTGVVASTRSDSGHGFYLWDSSNYIIYGLTVRYAGNYGMYAANSDNVEFNRNTIAFSNWTGLSASGGRNNKFIKNYIFHNFINNWPRGENNWLWGGWGAGLGIQGSASALVDGNISYKNGGEGILAYVLANDTIFKNNVSVDNWSVSFYMDNLKNGVIDSNVAICHTPLNSDAYNNGQSIGRTEVVRKQRATGITVADEEYSLSPAANLENIKISNNVIIRCSQGFSHNVEAIGGAGLKNIKFVNNTIIMPTDVHAAETKILGIDIPYNNGKNTDTSFQNNIILGGHYSSNNDTGYLMHSTNYGSMINFNGLTIDHNLFYQPDTSAKWFKWGGGSSWGEVLDYAGWLALSGGSHGEGDVINSPSFINLLNDKVLDKKLVSSSGGVDRGVSTGILKDYAGVNRPQGSVYDMGAFETSLNTTLQSQSILPLSAHKEETTLFTSNLKLGDDKTEVLQLQKFLNNQGFIVSKTGLGSVGNETTYFGAATKEALMKFQNTKSIKPAEGYFGSVTRDVINKMLSE
jgi:chitodextrinase